MPNSKFFSLENMNNIIPPMLHKHRTINTTSPQHADVLEKAHNMLATQLHNNEISQNSYDRAISMLDSLVESRVHPSTSVRKFEEMIETCVNDSLSPPSSRIP